MTTKNESRYKRIKKLRPYRDHLVLIVCEGEKTEPSYFEGFKRKHRGLRINLDIRIVPTGRCTLSLVKHAEAQHQARKKDFSETTVWCVFDKDDFPDQAFDNAISKAEDLGYKVAYSNQSFELWFLLHYEYINTGIHRDDYIKKLSKHLGKKYSKTDPDMYEKLSDYRDKAIENAKRLHKEYNDGTPPHQRCPDTYVDELISFLLSQIEETPHCR